MIFENEAGLVNFVCIVFEQGGQMLTLSSMENLIVECNPKHSCTPIRISDTLSWER